MLELQPGGMNDLIHIIKWIGRPWVAGLSQPSVFIMFSFLDFLVF
jgi:hypothetical protein